MINSTMNNPLDGYTIQLYFLGKYRPIAFWGKTLGEAIAATLSAIDATGDNLAYYRRVADWTEHFSGTGKRHSSQSCEYGCEGIRTYLGMPSQPSDWFNESMPCHPAIDYARSWSRELRFPIISPDREFSDLGGKWKAGIYGRALWDLSQPMGDSESRHIIVHVANPPDGWNQMVRVDVNALAMRSYIDVAQRFADILKDWLDPIQFETMRARNASPEFQSGACASGDCCDSNMAMAQALQSFGIDPLPDCPARRAFAAALWNRAWQHARESGLIEGVAA